MSEGEYGHTRRETIAALAAGGALSLVLGAAGAGATPASPEAGEGFRHDWDFLIGRWNVRHSKRTQFLKNAEWKEFGGTCVHSRMMDGQANVEDYLIEQPSGTYRALGIRAFDPKDQLWSIWWLDSRYPTAAMPAPLRGSFKPGPGGDRSGRMFEGHAEDSHEGKKVITRFQWTRLSTNPRWEQAMTVDDGKTWETNWRMDFTRMEV